MPEDMEQFDSDLDALLSRIDPDSRAVIAEQQRLNRSTLHALMQMHRVRYVLIWLLAGNVAMLIVNAALLWRLPA